MDEIYDESEGTTPTDEEREISKEELSAFMFQFGRDVDEYVGKHQESLALAKTFVDDLAWLQVAARAVGATQQARRIFVRTAYANAEGNLFVLKQLALHAGKSACLPPLSDEEIAFLNDKELRTDLDTGAVTEGKTKIGLKENIRKTRKILRRIQGCESFDIDLGTKSAKNFFDGIVVRDRLTHPKSFAAMTVTDEELLAVSDGIQWLNNSAMGFIAALRAPRKGALDQWSADIVEHAKRLGVDEGVIADFLGRVRPNLHIA